MATAVPAKRTVPVADVPVADAAPVTCRPQENEADFVAVFLADRLIGIGRVESRNPVILKPHKVLK
jgi:hypothetical protein